MGQSQSTSTSSARPITGARKQKVSRQDSLLETPALWNNGPPGNAFNIQSEEIVIPIQEFRPAPPPNRRPSYIPAVIFSPHDIRTPTRQTTASGRRKSLPGIRRAPRLLAAHPPVLHDDDESDTNQGSDDGDEDTDTDQQSTCSSSHAPQTDRPKTPLTDRPPTPWADASDSEPKEPPTSPLSPKQPPSTLPTSPSLIQTSLANTPDIVVKRYFTRYPRCCNALWLDQCYLSTTTTSSSSPSSSSFSSHLEDAILPSPAQAICPRCLHRAHITVYRLGMRTGCFDPDTETASRVAAAARRGKACGRPRDTIAFKFDLVEVAWVHEQLRRWKAAGEASAAAAAAIQKVCDLQPVGDERGKWRMGVGQGVRGGFVAGEGAGVEEREGLGEVDPGPFFDWR